MWGQVLEWLRLGAALPKDREILTDLTGVEKHHEAKSGKILLESKKDMKARGLASPDDGDALALTFAAPVVKKNRLFRDTRQTVSSSGIKSNRIAINNEVYC